MRELMIAVVKNLKEICLFLYKFVLNLDNEKNNL